MEPELSANLRDKRHSDYRWADSAMAVSAEWLGWTGRPYCLQTLDGVAALPRCCKVSIGYGVENRMLPMALRRKFSLFAGSPDAAMCRSYQAFAPATRR
jgi:hypothetical protein